MKTEYLVLGVAAVGLYLWYQSQNASNAQQIRYIQTYQNTGVTQGDVGSLGAQLQQSGINALGTIANTGINALTNWATNAMNGNSSGVPGTTETNLYSPTSYGYDGTESS